MTEQNIFLERRRRISEEMKLGLDSLPEFKEGASSRLESHFLRVVDRGYMGHVIECKYCYDSRDIEDVERNFVSEYCKQASIMVAKKNGTFNPEYKGSEIF